MIVVVDDERTFAGHVDVYLRTEDEALAWFARWLSNPYSDPITELWLDHDLGDGGTVQPVADFLEWVVMATGTDHPEIGQVRVHSQNPVGADRLVSTSMAFCSDVRRVHLPVLAVVS